MAKKQQLSLSSKISRILNGILIVMFFIIIRVWYLAVFQHEEKVEASQKPQRRHVSEKADRATISDRFGIPLAVNKIQYNVSVSYGGIREVPRTVWKINEEGKKVKVFKRKEYIEELGKMLGKELGLDSERLVDLIHSKASLFGAAPFLIKENISEKTYYRLKMLEKDFPGLSAEKGSIRSYPQGRSLSHIVGYLGAISKNEYEAITQEMQTLQNYLMKCEEGEEALLPKGYMTADQVSKRIKVLEGKAYTINDRVGKCGIERSYDEKLRGTAGLKTYLSDVKGNFLTCLDGGRDKLPGHHLKLSCSLELQKYAERLLAEYEASCQQQNHISNGISSLPENQPWIKGGAIVVMDPNNGEILTLASYPRFDPNDFIEKNAHVKKWLESESYIADLWNQKQSLKRERFDKEKQIFYEEELLVTWDIYLKMIFPKNSQVLKTIEKQNVTSACLIQQKAKKLLLLFESKEIPVSASKIFDFIYKEGQAGAIQTIPEKDFLNERWLFVKEEVQTLQSDLQPYLGHLKQTYEKLLLIDLCSLAVNDSLFDEKLLAKIGDLSLSEYRDQCTKLHLDEEILLKRAKELFAANVFKKWKSEHSKEYLALKRKEEETKKIKVCKPYIEYLDEAENEMFKAWWKKNRVEFISRNLKDSFDETIKEAYFKTFVSYEELNKPLLGIYTGLTQTSKNQTLKDLARAFYPPFGYAYERSQAFRRESAVGSIFKLVPAYEALRQKYLSLKEEGRGFGDLNPMTIIDDKHLKGKQWVVGFTADKRPIPRYYKGGNLPRSDHAGIGSVDLVKALAASSNPYFAMLAGDIIEDPEDLCKAAMTFTYGEKTGIDLPGEIKGNLPQDVAYNRTGLYSFSIGQHSLFGTPLQSAVMLATIANGGKVLKPKIVLEEDGKKIVDEIRREIFLPKPIRDLLIKGLRQVIFSEKGTARTLTQQFPEDLISHIVGKTSTAEVIERISLDGSNGKIKTKHVSFGAIYFGDDKLEKPELVVIVYLRFGEWGRIAAPYAVKMIQKWLELKEGE